jgi:hypothetical protein
MAIESTDNHMPTGSIPKLICSDMMIPGLSLRRPRKTIRFT